MQQSIKEYIHKICNGRSLLDVALDVHMTNTGSYERSKQAQDNDIEVITLVLKTWEPTVHRKYEEFDNAVKNLLTITLKEVSNANKTN